LGFLQEFDLARITPSNLSNILMVRGTYFKGTLHSFFEQCPLH